ncbi:MAG TPA: molybdenum cofactor guanylyltransferase [Candidatus Acidoferrales bacterium]|jgi:molybdopterin-guanine dinucleotide biosynthesis protein A|nr:molybdenum cofactor guanylyltransferase [Candidatus Acidoferrales bacterium]
MTDGVSIAGFILAGGESSRMGVDKGLLEIAGVPMIARAARLVESVVGSPVVVVGTPEKYRGLGLPAIADDWPGCGPLGGIATALRASDAEWNLIVACDLPYLTRTWLEYLLQRARDSAEEAVVARNLTPANRRGAEPLCAMYQKGSEPELRRALERGVRKVTDGLAELRVEMIEPAKWKGFDSDGLLFKNVNTPADYEQAKAKFAGRAEK